MLFLAYLLTCIAHENPRPLTSLTIYFFYTFFALQVGHRSVLEGLLGSTFERVVAITSAGAAAAADAAAGRSASHEMSSSSSSSSWGAGAGAGGGSVGGGSSSSSGSSGATLGGPGLRTSPMLRKLTVKVGTAWSNFSLETSSVALDGLSKYFCCTARGNA